MVANQRVVNRGIRLSSNVELIHLRKDVNFTKHLHKILAFLFVLLTKLLSNYLYKGHLVAK